MPTSSPPAERPPRAVAEALGAAARVVSAGGAAVFPPSVSVGVDTRVGKVGGGRRIARGRSGRVRRRHVCRRRASLCRVLEHRANLVAGRRRERGSCDEERDFEIRGPYGLT